ncbi:MAG: hypothetical protein HQ582_07740, partial [Planctomycetes bacterium]|nr:hypothetical protein [Planctomycetota bacterium]
MLLPCCSISVAMLLSLCAVSPDQQSGLLPNPGFSDGLDGWVYRPGDESQVSLVDAGADRGKALRMRPDGRLLGVETERLAFGRQLEPDQAYQVEAELKHAGLDSGVFAFSMYCFDANGKSLQQ